MAQKRTKRFLRVRYIAFFKPLYGVASREADDFVYKILARKKFTDRTLYEPGNVRVRKFVSYGSYRGDAHQHVSERAQPYDEDIT
jgi:hypothetical protein